MKKLFILTISIIIKILQVRIGGEILEETMLAGLINRSGVDGI